MESRSFDLEEVFTRFIKHAIILACGLVPICLIGYILFFADQKLIFKNFLVHEIIILMAVTWSGFITYIFYLCYAKTRETFLRYMALAFLGQTIIYAMHGILTRTADWIPILFILYGPASRVVLAGFFSAAILKYGTNIQDNVGRRSWITWGGVFVIILPFIALLAVSPIGTSFYLRAGMEILSIAMYMTALGIFFYRKINTPLMWLYSAGLVFFAESSLSFIFVKMPWNHLFWLSHFIFGAGFFVISYGLVRARKSTSSFAEIFTEDQLPAEREQAEAKLKTAQARLTDAIESISGGVTLYDSEDRFVTGNNEFFEEYREIADVLVPGTKFETIIRASAERGPYQRPPEDIGAWIEKRMREHRTQKHSDTTKRGDRWQQVDEYETHDGGTLLIRTDVTDRKNIEEKIQKSLAEKEVLLQEIHHRVKNNFQVISSLLSLQAAKYENEQVVEALEDSRQRVMAMARVHEHLYSSEDLASINAKDYLTSVVAGLNLTGNLQPQSASLSLDIEKLFLDGNQAISCGQAVIELVSNATKHAFPDGRSGTIEVSMRRTDGGWIELSVVDDGVGLPADFDVSRSRSLGLRLVEGFAAKLNGELSVDADGGTRFQILFPGKAV